MPEDLVEVFLDTKGTSQGRKIDPSRLRYFDTWIGRNLQQTGRSIGDRILSVLRIAYAIAIRERPRIEGEHLKDRLERAMVSQWMYSDTQLVIEIFNLFTIDELTRNEGQGTQDQGWFFLYEDGHEGRAHGSDEWTFIPIAVADKLAEEAADSKHLKGDKLSDFLSHIHEVFKGRHGEGIMVNMDDYLFFQIPEFGTPRELGIKKTHPGFAAWNVLYNSGVIRELGDQSSGNEGRNWITDLVDKAFDSAAGKLFV